MSTPETPRGWPLLVCSIASLLVCLFACRLRRSLSYWRCSRPTVTAGFILGRLTPLLLAAPRGFAEVVVSMFERSARIAPLIDTWQSNADLILKRDQTAARARGDVTDSDALRPEAGASVTRNLAGLCGSSGKHEETIAPRPGTAPQPLLPESAWNQSGRPGTAPTGMANEVRGGSPSRLSRARATAAEKTR